MSFFSGDFFKNCNCVGFWESYLDAWFEQIADMKGFSKVTCNKGKSQCKIKSGCGNTLFPVTFVFHLPFVLFIASNEA